MKKKILAFTLAETLIVMGVIGIVAALTLPNLNSSTNNKEKVAKVKKIYQNLNDAFGRATAVYGPLGEWFKNDSSNQDYAKRFATRLTEFMKISKDCAFDTSGKCFTKQDKIFYESTYKENKQYSYNKDFNYKILLADGTSVSIKVNKSSNLYTAYIYFDIDGPNKGPSAWGSDLFRFAVNSSQNGDLKPIFHEEGEQPGGDSYSDDYAGWIINYDNADYLNTSDGYTCKNNNKELSWGGNISCN